MRKNNKTKKYSAKVFEKSNKKITNPLKMCIGCRKISYKIAKVGEQICSIRTFM